MSEPLSAERLAEIRARAEAALDEVVRMCAEPPHLRWRWSIPANPQRDSDLILSGSLMDVPDLLAEVDRLAAENARLVEIVARVCERRASRWFSVAHEPGERLPSHDGAGHGHDATPADERGGASAFRPTEHDCSGCTSALCVVDGCVYESKQEPR